MTYLLDLGLFSHGFSVRSEISLSMDMFLALLLFRASKRYFTNSSLVMPKPVFLMTVQEAHQEYTSLTDKIWAKYEQLDSGKFGSPGTPAFDAEARELPNLLAHVSELCKN